MKDNKGFSSIEFLVTLLFLSMIIIAFGIIIRTSDFTVKKKTADLYDREYIDKLLVEIYEEIKNDKTPYSDSKYDSVWKYDNTMMEGFKISIKSLSGLINLNFITKDLISKTELNSLFLYDNAMENIYDLITDKGLLYSYEEINQYIEKDKYDNYFTLYGFSNFNISNNESIKKLTNNLTNSSFGDDLINKRNILIRNKQLIQNETELNLLCGIHYDEIFPFININPPLNINFMDENLIRIILSFQDFKLPGAQQKANSIIELRDSKEITQEELVSILGITKGDELYYYIGCKTWVWQILIEGDSSSCNVILIRDPEDTILGEPKLYVIEKQWL